MTVVEMITLCLNVAAGLVLVVFAIAWLWDRIFG